MPVTTARLAWRRSVHAALAIAMFAPTGRAFAGEATGGGAALVCEATSAAQGYLAAQGGHAPIPGAPPPGGVRPRAALLASLRAQIDFAARAAATGVFCPRLPDNLTAWIEAIDRAPGRTPELSPARAALVAHRDRLRLLARAARELGGQASTDETPYRLPPARARSLAHETLRRLTKDAAEHRCRQPPGSTAGFFARELLLGFSEAAPPEADVRKDFLAVTTACAMAGQAVAAAAGWGAAFGSILKGAQQGRVADPAAAPPGGRAGSARDIASSAIATGQCAPADIACLSVAMQSAIREQLIRSGVPMPPGGFPAGGPTNAVAPVPEPPSPAVTPTIAGAEPRRGRARSTDTWLHVPPPAPQVSQLACEAAVFDGAGDAQGAAARRDRALDVLGEGGDAAEPALFMARVEAAGLASERVARHAEALDRIQSAWAALRASAVWRDLVAHPRHEEDPRLFFQALAETTMKDVAARAGRPVPALPGASREPYPPELGSALDLVRKYSLFAASDPTLVPNTDMFQIMAGIGAKRGDLRAHAAELKRAGRVTPAQLLLLHELALETDDRAEAAAALADAAEGISADVNRTLGAAGGFGDLVVVEQLSRVEGLAALATRRPGATPAEEAQLFWLTEQRKGRLFQSQSFSAQVSDEHGARLLAALRAKRSTRAAAYWKDLTVWQSPFLAEGLRECERKAGHQDVEDPADAKMDAEAAPLRRGQAPPVVSPAGLTPFFQLGAMRADYPHGSPAVFVADVASRLPAGARLVSYARVLEGFDGIQRADGKPLERAPAPRYVAFTLGPKGLRMHDLGDASEIDREVAQALTLLEQPGPASAPAPRALLDELQSLHRRLWQPLGAELAGARLITVVADGPLQGLPFASLHDGQQWLAERCPLSHLHSARDLLATPWPASKRPALVFADPVMPRGPDSPSTVWNLKPLAGARDEGRDVQQSLPGSVLLTNSAATEAALLGSERPHILHVASHAVLFSDEALIAAHGGSADASHRGLVEKTAAPPRPRLQKLSLGAAGGSGWLHAALVLSPGGADGPREAGVPRPTWDGFATAYEILTMDLRGTELVTLSACETGGGEAVSHHGVASLEHAFLDAGAASVIASLWQVSDASTVLWMRRFYTSLLGGQPRAEAVKQAMAAVRSQFPHPRFWAPFVLTGAAGTLQ